MNLSSDFPGGNIVVERIDGETATLHQDLRDTAGDWFYWCFRITGAAGRTVRFHFSQSAAIGVRGPAISSDAGGTWRWLGAEAIEGNGFSHAFGPGENDVLFGMTMPYTEAHWRAFLTRHAGDDRLETGTLCLSRKGRPVESLRLGGRAETPRHRVLLTARHHCCETMASYVLEGVVSFVLGEEPEADWLRNQVEFLIIPFMDKDGVEAGDQGKNRAPRDHNRDYDGASLYAETATLRESIPGWFAEHPVVALDLHCPWLRGERNETLYLVGQPSPDLWREQQRFSDVLEKTRKGPLPFRAADDLPFGREWNTTTNYRQGKSFARWASELPGARLVSTLEIPYANAGGVPVDAHSARSFGEDLARALACYLKDSLP